MAEIFLAIGQGLQKTMFRHVVGETVRQLLEMMDHKCGSKVRQTELTHLVSIHQFHRIVKLRELRASSLGAPSG